MDNFIICIDLGGTNTKIALANCKAKILRKIVITTAQFTTKASLLKAVVSSIRNLLAEDNISTKKILGIGVGVAGPVNIKKGIIYSMTNVKGFRNVNLKKIFEKKLKIPVFVDNDTKLMAIAEMIHGAGKGAMNAICLTLGTGVGGAVVTEGKLYRGSDLVAGEIGHIPINTNGPRCNCGGMACLEKYVGNKAIAKRAVDKILKNRYKGMIMKLVNGNLNKITPQMLKYAADKGDRFAIEIWKSVANDLAVALTGLINLLNPDRIIIGGGVANADRFLFGPLRIFIKRRSMAVPGKRVIIVKAALGENAGIIGAAEYVKQNLLRHAKI